MTEYELFDRGIGQWRRHDTGGAFFLVSCRIFRLGAVIAGIAIAFGIPGSGGLPFIIFSVSSIILLLVARNHMKTWFKGDLVEEKNTDIDTGII